MKKIAIKMFLIVLVTPLITILLVKFITPLINDDLPHNIREVDAPLYSHMLLNKNYNSYLYKYNIFSGFEKFKYTTNEHGFRSPKIDFNKNAVLISGDSIPFGVSLNDTETFGWLLNNDINKYHFINAGIPSKAIAHNLLTLEHFLEIYKNKGSKIKYFVNYINWRDFLDVKNRTYPIVLKKWKKTNLSLKEKLRVRFPTLGFIYGSFKRPSGINTKLITFFKSIFFIPNKQTLAQYHEINFSHENLEYMKKILLESKKNNFKIINVITPFSKYDLFNKNTNSNKLYTKLIQMGFKNNILVKDILINDITLKNKIDVNGHYTHFSKYAMKKVSNVIQDKIQSIDLQIYNK